MKKFLLVLIAFSLVFSLCACNSEKRVLEQANELINNNQVKEAYELLYANQDYEAVREMLLKFNIVYTKAESKSYTVFNRVGYAFITSTATL